MSETIGQPLVILAEEAATSSSGLGESFVVFEEFGVVASRAPDDDVANIKKWLAAAGKTVRAVIVASKNEVLPEAWARASGRPTIRVPVGLGHQPPLSLLQDARGQLPAGKEEAEFATMAIGAAGARNAALFVVSMLSLTDPVLREKWLAFRARQTAAVLAGPALELED